MKIPGLQRAIGALGAAFVALAVGHTQLKRAEAAQKLRSAADAAGIGTWYWDLATGAWTWGDWCKTLFGDGGRCPLRYEDAFLQLIHEDDRQGVDEDIRKALQERSEYVAEVRVVLSSGLMRWVLIKGSGFYDTNKKPLRMHGVAMDVTEHREAGKNRLQLASVVETTRGAIFSKDLDGTILTWNIGAEKMYGYSAEEAIGKNITFLVPPTYPNDTVWILETVRNGGYIENYETVRMHKDGGLLHVSLTVTALKDVNGRVIGASSIGIDITGRKKAEAELIASEARFTAFMDHVPAATWVKDRFGRYTYANRAMVLTHLFPVAAIIGKSDDELVAPEIARQLRENDQRVLASNQSILITEVFQGADGRELEFLVSKFPLPGPGGLVDQVAGVALDITELRQAERKLRESEERFTAFMDGLPALAWVKDHFGRYVYVNSEYGRRLLSIPAASMIGKRDEDFFTPEHSRQFRENDERVLASNESILTTETIRGADGIERELLVNKFPLRGPDGLAQVAGVAIDITELRQTERKLQESEAQFRQLAETLQQLVWMTDPDGAVTYLNGRWSEYTGRSLDETGGWKWTESLHPDDYSRTVARWTQSVETGEEYEAECRLKRHDGEYRWFIARGVPIRGEGGRITRWFGSNIDIEDQKRAREEAEAVARVKSEFLANMSHEIRTPMNGILGMTDLLQDTSLTPLQRQYLEMLKNSGETLLSVVNDVLDFSKLEAGAMTLDTVAFDLRDTVEKAAESLSIRAFQKGLELTVVLAPDLPNCFLGDPGKLRQVILNLVSNAVKFTEQGEVVVRVEGHPAEEAWSLCFSITDTGIGIPPDKQSLIFESFSQADTTTSRLYGGTGLGLAICRRIIDRMGGRLWVESTEGRGSTFSFEVRLCGTECPHLEAQLSVPHLEGVRALVVDDNETNRLMLQTALAALGLAVETAVTADEAIRKALDHPFDLILLDLRLPDMDGFQVAQRLRTHFPIDRQCIMMITSDDIAGGASRARELGMTAYLVKPIRIEALKRALLSLIAADTEAVTTQEEPDTAPATTEVPLCIHVLLADDNPVNLTVAETILRKGGVRVTCATNGAEVVDASDRTQFNLILMDVQMPEMDGYEATRIIRSKGSDIPIIGLTAHALAGDRQRCLAAGMDDYLSKPVTADNLMRMVASWAHRHPLPPTDPAALLAELEGDRETYDIMVHTFLENAPSQLEDVRDAVMAADAPTLQRAAHRLKGALLAVKAQRAQCLAERLEHSAEEGNLGQGGDIFRQLEGEVLQVMEQLRQHDVTSDRETCKHENPAR